MFRQPREVHGEPEGVRSTERSEAHNAPTRSEGARPLKINCRIKFTIFFASS